jgi:beta-lactamase class A
VKVLLKRISIFLIFLLAINTVALAAPSLNKEIYSDLKGFNGNVGVYAKNLRTGRDLSYNEDIVFPTASTSKLVVALSVYKYIYPKVSESKKAQYDKDVQYMITVSDNDSFYELLNEIDALQPAALQKTVKDLRLKRTQIHSDDAFKRYGYHSVTTPYEMAKVMESVYNDRYLGRNKSAELKDELANTIYHDEIPRFMLTKVMHKVGELDNILCDVGIVDDGKDQILISVYTTSDNPDGYASDFIAAISAKLYNALRRK